MWQDPCINEFYHDQHDQFFLVPISLMMVMTYFSFSIHYQSNII